MSSTTNFLAVDLGASSGRVLVGRWDGEKFGLEELHRFPNGPVNLLGRLHWDVLRLWGEIKAGMTCYAQKCGASLAGISVDAWGVDFALLDRSGQLLGNPFHYRDTRTQGVPERVHARVPPEEIFQQTGIQSMPINTLFQLFSMVMGKDAQLEAADRLLLVPDLFHYWLTGQKVNELTAASTTQMLSHRTRHWAVELLAKLSIPANLLGPIAPTGTILSGVRSEVLAETGLFSEVPAILGASHDTASAAAAVPFLDEHSIFISSGTWSLVGMETREPLVNEKARLLNLTNEAGAGGQVLLMRNLPGLWLLQECQRQWQREGQPHSCEDVLRLAAMAKPFQCLLDTEDPDFLLPGDMPKVIRAYCRRTDQFIPETIGEIARCCLESLGLKYRWVLDALESLKGVKVRTIRIVGGGSQNDLLCQFTANACQRQVVAGPVEATALGNVMMQAITTGHLPDIKAGRQRIAASVAQKSFDPVQTDSWEEAYHRLLRLVDMKCASE